MANGARISTRADLFETRKQQYLQAGYRIENEQPTPMNGLCSFVAVRIASDDSTSQ